MALPVKDQIKYWTSAAAILVLFLWLLGDILLPFVLGAALAYLLDPIVDRLERLGTGRVLGTTLILVAAFFVVFFILTFIYAYLRLMNSQLLLYGLFPLT